VSEAARQRVLAVILPALVTATVYWTFIALPAARARRQAPVSTAHDVASANDAVVALQRRRLEAERRSLLAQRQTVLAPWTKSRSERLGSLALLLEQHQVRLVAEGPLPNRLELDPALRQLEQWLQGSPTASPGSEIASSEPGCWQVDVVGRYSDVAAALAEIAQREDLLVLALQLLEVKTAGNRWRFVLWG
jgi:hypothetical protein